MRHSFPPLRTTDGSTTVPATRELEFDSTDFSVAQSGVKATVSLGTISTSEAHLLENVGIASSASAGALTVSLKQSDGSTDPSTGTSAVKIAYRSATVTNGGYTQVSTTGSLSVVVPSGATLGYANGSDTYVHVYAINNSGSTELAVIGSRYFDDGEVVSTTAIGTGSDAGTTLYSTSARSNVPCRYLGYFRINAITTAGTWTTPDAGSIFPDELFKEPSYLKDVKTDGTHAGTSSSTTNHTRVLNTQEGNTSFVVLSSNQFTLLPGVYEIQASAPCFRGDSHQAYIYNTTASATSIIGQGSNGGAGAGDNEVTFSHLFGKIDISVTSTFELRHWIETGQATYGLGLATSSGQGEIYSMVKIIKER